MICKTRGTRKVKQIKPIGKKAFIMSFIVDFWAYITFVLVVIIFAMVYKYLADAKLQAVEDVKDIVYGNYLSQVYLRKPIVVGEDRMTMAELIAMYDYNQTIEQRGKKEPTSTELLFGNQYFFYGRSDNAMWNGIVEVTEEFIDENFDDSKCYVFAMKGNDFEYARFGSKCNLEKGFSLVSALPQFGVPEKTFLTILPSVDPRNDPIEIYVVYDLKRLIELYSKESYIDIMVWAAWGTDEFCRGHPLLHDCMTIQT